MKPTYRSAAKSAKPPAVKVFGKSRTDVRWFAPVLVALRAKFPRKLAKELAYYANRTPRVCEKWIAGRGAPDGEALANLQNSQIGDLIWLALTQGCGEIWAIDRRKQIKVSQLRRKHREIADELKALEGES